MNALNIKSVLNSTLSTSMLLLAVGVAVPLASLADTWELRTVKEEVPGTREIESGETLEGIRISEGLLDQARAKDKVAVLNNLCVGYIQIEDFEKAEQFCELAVETEEQTVVTHNNRGVLKAIEGRFTEASEDFERAWANGCIKNCEDATPTSLNLAHHVALRNLERTQQLMIAQQSSSGEGMSLTAER